MGSLLKIFAICILPLVSCQYQQQQRQQQQPQQGEEQHNFLDIQSPEFFAFTPSPLQKPDSLRNQPYFDFLSTLYRHDSGKNDLFKPYTRSRRDASLSPVIDTHSEKLDSSRIKKRAIVFRPLFVYRQQQVHRERIQERRRRY